jgi:hypothetical protein
MRRNPRGRKFRSGTKGGQGDAPSFSHCAMKPSEISWVPEPHKGLRNYLNETLFLLRYFLGWALATNTLSAPMTMPRP